MANKKFYYNNRKSESNSSQNAATAPDITVAGANFDAGKLSLSLIELGVVEQTLELLAKFNITTVADLVRRTEKDMYKVQGLNKKVLLELRTVLQKLDMVFKPDQQRPQSIEQKNTQSVASTISGVSSQKQIAKVRDENDRAVNAAPNANRTERNQQINGNNRNQSANKTERNQPIKGNDRNRNSKRNENEKDARGKFIVPAQVERPKRITEPLPVDEWRKIQKGEKWGFFDGMKTVVPAMYDEVFCFKEGLASVELDEKCGFIDCENNIIIPFDYETALSFSEGFASVVKGGKCGYINKENDVVIAFQFDAATQFEDGEAKIKKDSRWGSITSDGVIRWM